MHYFYQMMISMPPYRQDVPMKIFWAHPVLVADAKAWHLSLDQPFRTGRSREYPPEQIEWYLTHSLLDYGILTNGRLWRLFPRELGPNKKRFQTYLEVDLEHLLNSASSQYSELEFSQNSNGFDSLVLFFLFFGPIGFTSFEGRVPLVARAISGSSEYSLGVGEGTERPCV